jgi:hypothetical protein
VQSRIERVLLVFWTVAASFKRPNELFLRPLRCRDGNSTCDSSTSAAPAPGTSTPLFTNKHAEIRRYPPKSMCPNTSLGAGVLRLPSAPVAAEPSKRINTQFVMHTFYFFHSRGYTLTHIHKTGARRGQMQEPNFRGK